MDSMTAAATGHQPTNEWPATIAQAEQLAEQAIHTLENLAHHLAGLTCEWVGHDNEHAADRALARLGTYLRRNDGLLAWAADRCDELTDPGDFLTR